jgi:hypothetical protein
MCLLWEAQSEKALRWKNALNEPLFLPGGTTRRAVLSKPRYVPVRLADQNNSLSSKSKI